MTDKWYGAPMKKLDALLLGTILITGQVVWITIIWKVIKWLNGVIQ